MALTEQEPDNILEAPEAVEVNDLNKPSGIFEPATSTLDVIDDVADDPASQEALLQGIAAYTDDNIVTLEWNKHIRHRPGMYIGKLGDGSNYDDGIYVLLKEILDNSIDEYMMGFGKQIHITINEDTVTVQDFGRGIPLKSLVAVASTMNTGGKYDTKTFKKSVGQNGVGIKAVNALSTSFIIRSVRDSEMREVKFSAGDLLEDSDIVASDLPPGTTVTFIPDNTIFKNFKYRDDFVVPLIKNFTFLNTGLVIYYNKVKYVSRNGLLDLLRENMTNEPLYQPIHLKGEDIEVVITHCNQYGEEYYSFVNGQHTTQGGSHLTAFKEAVSRTIKDYFGKNFEYSDIRNGMVAAISVKVIEPVFESQTKSKLNSKDMGPEGPTVAKFVGDFIKRELDNYLHRNLETAEIILKKVQDSERDRKAMAGVTKIARERAKKVSVHNKKLLDCRIHLNDTRGDQIKKLATSIFLTEGDSAAGSITKIRDVETQAVFALKGKPLNSYGMNQKVVYENEEFNLLQAALNIEDGIEGLRYNNIIIATDADVDGMHIRLLLLTFFLQYFPELVKKGHVYVLETPLFRIRNKKAVKRGASKKGRDKEETIYCYTDEERIAAIEKFGTNAVITRFKGLGEISPDEFKEFIGEDMRVDRVTLRKDDGVKQLLEFYMGKNTRERRDFIINNLVIEDDSQIS